MLGLLKPFTSLVSSFLGHSICQEGGGGAGRWLQDRLQDRSRRLPEALAAAYERAWGAIEVALSDDKVPVLSWVTEKLTPVDEQALRAEVSEFLSEHALRLPSARGECADSFRAACREEVQRARELGLLSAARLDDPAERDELAERTAVVSGRFGDAAAVIEDARRAVGEVADRLRAAGLNCLADLVAGPEESDGPPYLTTAFAYFFRRQVGDDPTLAGQLIFDVVHTLQTLRRDRRDDGKRLDWRLNGIEEQMNRITEQLARPGRRALPPAFTAKCAAADEVLERWRAVDEAVAAILADRLAGPPDPARVDRARGLEVRRRALGGQLGAARDRFVHEMRHPCVVLATTGTTSSGKSALVNLLCGSQLMPVALGEMSAGVITIHHGPQRRLWVRPTDNAQWTCDALPAAEELEGATPERREEIIDRLMESNDDRLFARLPDLTDQQIYDRLTDVMESYNRLRGSAKEPACPQAVLRYPTRLGLHPELLDLPEGCSYRILDLPGVKYVGDETNLRVIRRSAGEALCLVLYNSADVDPKRKEQLLEEVAAQVKELGGSPARMLFVLNRLDEFRRDPKGQQNLEEFVYRTTEAIKRTLGERLPEFAREVANIRPARLCTLPALWALRGRDRQGEERAHALRQLEKQFNYLIPEELIADLPRTVARWKDADVRAVTEAVWRAAHADTFHEALGRHIREHLPELVLPQAINRFRGAAGREAVEWALHTARAELNSSQERYRAESQAIAQARDDLRALRDASDRRLRAPFDAIRQAITARPLGDEAAIDAAVASIRNTMIELEHTPPYDALPQGSLAPLHTWRDDLALTVDRLVGAVGHGLLAGEDPRGDAVEQLPRGTRRRLLEACRALREAGYDRDTARHGGTARARTDEEKQQLRTIQQALAGLAERLKPALEDAVYRAARGEIGRIHGSLERLYQCHRQDVGARAQEIAPGLGLEMPAAVLDAVDGELTATYEEIQSDMAVERRDEQEQVRTEQVKTGTRQEQRRTGEERAWYNPLRWVLGKDVYETVTVPVFTERPVFEMVSYDVAEIPSAEQLVAGWKDVTKRRDPHVIGQFADWLMLQAGQMSRAIEEFQENLLDRYQGELDRAHAAARQVSEQDQALWSAVEDRAQALKESFERFSALRPA